MTEINKHIGSALDEFLKEEGVLSETRAIARAIPAAVHKHTPKAEEPEDEA